MSRCDNENIVKCLGAEIHEQEIWILMEFCEGGSLRDIMNNSKKSFGEEEIATFIAQALRGLVYLH